MKRQAVGAGPAESDWMLVVIFLACFKDWNNFCPARTIRKRSVNEHDILHGSLL